MNVGYAENDAKADVPVGMSAVGGRADAAAAWSEQPLVARTGSAVRFRIPRRTFSFIAPVAARELYKSRFAKAR